MRDGSNNGRGERKGRGGNDKGSMERKNRIRERTVLKRYRKESDKWQ